MLKRLFLYSLFTINLFAANNEQQESSSTSTTMIVVYCAGAVVVIAGGVLAAPLILPASTVLAIQTSAVTVGTSVANAFVVVTPYAQGVSYGISAGRIVRPYVIQTTQEQLDQFFKKEADELVKIKTELNTCFMKHTSDKQRDSSGCPTACQDIAFTFAILAGQGELDKIIKNIQKD